MTTQGEATWERRWNQWLSCWEIFYPKGKPSEEGTQAIEVVAQLKSALVADAIISDHNERNALERRAEQAEAKLRVAVEALTKIADKRGMPWPDYEKKWGDIGNACDIAIEYAAQLEAMDPQSSTPESRRNDDAKLRAWKGGSDE